MNKKQTVFVGLSGGVDSSVAALRLKRDGFDVVGVFIKVWHPDWLVCNWEQERLDAMRVAAKLDIPFLTCDAEASYRDEVAKYFIESYKSGLTPNPDVMCNKYVKFGAFLDFAHSHGAELIATGHYARHIKNGDESELHRGLDPEKDQSYFLWTLTKNQLEKSLFPVGNSPKTMIRQEAKKAGLLTAEKRDSQGICFLGQVDIKEFMSHYIDLQPGFVLDENGEKVGKHEGALIYTIGQRHGFTLDSKSVSRTPHYVISRDLIGNTITVSPTKSIMQQRSTITLHDVALRHGIKVGDQLLFQTRYRQNPNDAIITAYNKDHKTLTLKVENSTESPAEGQSCVLYEGTLCLGGGIIAPCQ